jgi:hypothetical protein
MRPPTERDQCQAKLDILIEGFMRADWTAYRGAAAWLRDFTNQKNIERGRMIWRRRLILAELFAALAYSKRYPVISERKRLST